MIWQQRKSPEVWTSAGYRGLHKKKLLSMAGVAEKQKATSAQQNRI